MMKTELISKTSPYEPTKNLVESLPLKDRKKHYNNGIVQHTQSLKWEDIQGLSWIFLNEKEI